MGFEINWKVLKKPGNYRFHAGVAILNIFGLKVLVLISNMSFKCFMNAPTSGFYGFGNHMQRHPLFWKIVALMPEVTMSPQHNGNKRYQFKKKNQVGTHLFKRIPKCSMAAISKV